MQEKSVNICEYIIYTIYRYVCHVLIYECNNIFKHLVALLIISGVFNFVHLLV